PKRNGPGEGTGAHRSVSILRQARRRYPGDFWINLTLADSLKKSRPPRLAEAIGYYIAAVALRPQVQFEVLPQAHNDLGVALQDKGFLDEAIAEYREALRLREDFPDAHNKLGVALREKGRLDEAIAEFRAATRLKKDFPQAATNLAAALRWQELESRL